MPIDNVPDPGEWTEDWYTTWKSRKENPNNLKLFEKEENMEAPDDNSDERSESSSSSSEDKHTNEEKTGAVKSDDESSWGEEPEIGELCTVRLRTGERVSRVTGSTPAHYVEVDGG
eukprot:CAMPEP_0197453262 /NCGR_PEP_ID=MMETSP1175-20131217/34437_1 /TAXON_ID=1003142 /ORGANISM="Triceratium dubium, Strain CCMP147" /LENGTH=115 /DNA_ID=CAMNT_0042986495 /DNA_START=288 /DNA_END=632 /DNA_ORIENTATION=-